MMTPPKLTATAAFSALGAKHKVAYGQHAQLTVDVLLQGKWSIQVLCAMRFGPVRLGQLGRSVSGASKKMLAQALRKLEANGIVVRRDLSELVLHVEYALHPDVRDSVVALIDQLEQWGDAFMKVDIRRSEAEAKPQRKLVSSSYRRVLG
jgi:DNA-binding HxlR family transcriptional regulator